MVVHILVHVRRVSDELCSAFEGLGYHRDPQTRAAFMEVLTKILQQGTEFETLAETALAERLEKLMGLVSTINDKGELPIVAALAHVISYQHMDELARVLALVFDAKHMLQQLLWTLFLKEVDLCSVQTADRPRTCSHLVRVLQYLE